MDRMRRRDRPGRALLRIPVAIRHQESLSEVDRLDRFETACVDQTGDVCEPLAETVEPTLEAAIDEVPLEQRSTLDIARSNSTDMH